MQKMFTTLLILVAISALAQNKQLVTPLTNGYIITGEFQGATHKKIYLRENSFYKDVYTLDSTIADKTGKFFFKGMVEEPTYYEIATDGKNGYISFILENSKIKITRNTDSIWVTGSKEEDIAQRLNQLSIYPQFQLKEFDKAYDKAKADSDTTALRIIQQQKEQLYRKRLEVLKEFISSYPTAVVSVGLLGDFLMLDSLNQAEELLKKFEKSNVSNLGQLRFFKNKIEVLKRLSIGALAPDFIQPDVFGNSVKLSSFRGKYVLLDFWASWCLPCRQENPNLVNVYNKYSDKDFTIISVSIDQNKDDWLQAIKKDNMTWINVSDLQTSNKSLVQRMYVASGIPDNYLIDPNGKIIAKRLLGDELNKRLEGLLR
jgi:thiol-disulfide isomerase/thioredoxin